MKNKNENRGAGSSLAETILNHSRKFGCSVTLLAALSLAPVSAHASYALLDGTGITTNNVPYNSATNASGVVTNNYQNGQVAGATSVFYYLSTTLGAQPSFGTNGLPALVLNTKGGYPGSLTGPGKNLAIQIEGQLMATNATSTAVVLQFAVTDTGKQWVTNFITAAYTVPVNAIQPAGGVWITNLDIGAHSYVALQQINNPGVAAFTNIVVRIANAPGL